MSSSSDFPKHGIFVTGTNTEVGKTYVSCLIARWLLQQGLRVGVYKPVASGAVQKEDHWISEDAESLWLAAGRPLTLEDVCPQIFKASLAPNIAAREEDRTVDAKLLRSGLSKWTTHCDIVIVEGVGGLMSPISDEDYVADLAADFGYPLIVIAANQLGVINQTLQTLITAATLLHEVPIQGVVLNDVDVRNDDASVLSNVEEVRDRIVPPYLGHVRHGADNFPNADESLLPLLPATS